MQTFNTIAAARDAIMDFPPKSLPEHLRERFRALRSSPSPVDQIVKLGEFLYANRDQIDDEALELSGGLIGYATINAWHGLSDENRGDRIVQAIRRDLSEQPPAGSEWPQVSTDPAPQAQYVTAPPAAAAPAADA